MATYLTSDTHFGHAGIIAMVGRPFANVAAIDDGMVAIWNAVVRPNDVVWHLGDFSLGPRGMAERLFRRLNGTKHLVRGNHDGDDVVKGCAWASVQDMASFKADGTRLILCHYPMVSWRGSSHNRDGHVASIMAHGHVHGTPRDSRMPWSDPALIDVGVDMRAFAPLSVEALVAEARAGAELAAGR